MKIRFRHFPHPVMAEFLDDFTSGEFISDIKDISSVKSSYKFAVTFDAAEQDMKKLIDNKQAHYSLHIECPMTYFRTLITSFEDEIEVEISADKLEGRVEMAALITAAENIPDYFCRGFDEQLKEYNFKVEKGDILAVGRQLNFDADKKADSIKNITSIFSVQPTENEEPAYVDMSTSTEKIIIWLPPSLFERYKELKQDPSLTSVLASMLVTPVLTEILQDLKERDEEALIGYEQCRWFKVLKRRLKEIGIEYDSAGGFTDNSVAAAQRLIGYPAGKAFEDLADIEEALI